MESDKLILRYKQNYCRIFESIYPSKNSTGFTERNLSVNFAKAYEHFHPDAITWFEFQFGEKNNLHYDAVIIDPTLREVIIVESKRFSNTQKKVSEVAHDICRICDFSSKHFEDFSKRIPNLSEYSVTGVILADIWTETKGKTALKNSFAESSFVKEHLPQLYEQQKDWFIDGQYFCLDLSDVGPSEVYDNCNIRKNYHLVGMIWKVCHSD